MAEALLFYPDGVFSRMGGCCAHGGSVFPNHRGHFARRLSRLGCRSQLSRCVSQWWIGAESYPDHQRRRQPRDDTCGHRGATDRDKLGARSVRCLGYPLWLASTRHRRSPLEELRSAVDNDLERRSVGAGRRIFHFAVPDADDAIVGAASSRNETLRERNENLNRCWLCCVWSRLFRDLCGVAVRERSAPQASVSLPLVGCRFIDNLTVRWRVGVGGSLP
jgi:hypothetical protein